jgi:preprotein translocase subunit SecD
MNTKVLVVGSGILFAILLWLGFAYYVGHTASALLPNQPAHGMSLVLQVSAPASSWSTNDLASLREAIRHRADRLGFRIYWEPQGAARARVVAPILNAVTVEEFKQALCRSGTLEFRLVHADSEQLLQSGLIPPGYQILQQELPQSFGPPGAGTVEKLVVKAAPEEGLSGPLVKHAFVTKDNLGQPQISFELNAAPAFARVTRENVQRRLAIIVDGKLLSAPVIRDPIETGQAVISGHFSEREALELTAALESPLPGPVAVVEAKQF